MTLLATLRAELQAAAEPERAPGMQAYMKSAMPYHGVKAPVAQKIYKRLFKDVEASEALVRELWDGATHREERYGALALARKLMAMDLFEYLIVQGAWWDYVDDLATHHVGTALRAHPDEVKPMMLEWSRSENLWKRRSAIICQVGSKGELDLGLLYACIEPALSSKEFFLRKAIGWALREHAWRDPREVVRYVEALGGRLSPLSRREALKNVNKHPPSPL